MLDWLAHLLNSHGYLTITLALFLVNLLPPVPAESTVPFAAALFDASALNIPMAIAAATLGLVLGTLPFYYLGRRLGEARVKNLLAAHGKWLALTPNDVDRSGRWFRRYGGSLVVFGRLVPGMRSLISIPAGFHRMPLRVFLFYTVIGCASWASILMLAGHWMSHGLAGVTSRRILLLFLAVFFCFYIYRLIRHSRTRDIDHGGVDRRHIDE